MPTALELAARLREEFGEVLAEPALFRGEVSLQVADPARITEICQFARTELGFDYLTDLSSIDNYGSDPRWTVVYELSSMGHGEHVRLRVDISEESSSVPTVSGVWPTADWHEREVYDMMGIRFQGHPDMRRILMWEGYPYHPLRKDFPLAGKATDLPEVAFTQPAPLEGGPFVTTPGGGEARLREPRVRNPEEN